MSVSDWQDTFMLQEHPQKLKKIEGNIADLKGLLRPEDSLIDVGCGHGFLYTQLEHENYLGVDRDSYSVEEAIKLHGPKFRQCDLFDLEGKWDVVWCSRVLIHIPLQPAMEKLLSLAGRLLVVVVKIGADEVSVETVPAGRTNLINEDRKRYFQIFSEDTMRSFGKCEIRKYPVGGYSTVIYGID